MGKGEIPVELSSLDCAVLDVIQCGFPLCPDPYAEIAATVGSTRAAVHAAVVSLRRRGVIRRLGGSFAASRMDYVSVLVAARVSPEHLDAAAAHLGAFAEVTHSYERAHRYNLWFTVIAETSERLDAILDDIRRVDGVQAVHPLPALQTFKIRVDFKFGGRPAHAE